VAAGREGRQELYYGYEGDSGEADGYYSNLPKPESAQHTLLSASHRMALGGSDWPRGQRTSLHETDRGAGRCLVRRWRLGARCAG
jgi:hypothetical protein